MFLTACLLLFETLCICASNIPTRLRLSLPGDDTSDVIVTWTTINKPLEPVVRYGLTTTESGTTTSWNIQINKLTKLTSKCVPLISPTTYVYPLKNYTSLYIGHCRLLGLASGMSYTYTVESSSNSVTSLKKFLAPIGPATTTTTTSTTSTLKPLKIAFIGDLGQTINSTSTINHLLNSKPFNFNHLVIVGDMSYADSQKLPWGKCVCVIVISSPSLSLSTCSFYWYSS